MANQTAINTPEPTAPVVVIPAYQPTERLVGIVEQLLADPEQVVILVDDGSSESLKRVFAAVADKPRLHILRHAVNLGKGQALKTAFSSCWAPDS